jgi:hypothetical protein
MTHELSFLARTPRTWVESQSRHGCLCAFILCFVVLRVDSGLATGCSSLSKGSYRRCIGNRITRHGRRKGVEKRLKEYVLEWHMLHQLQLIYCISHVPAFELPDNSKRSNGYVTCNLSISLCTRKVNKERCKAIPVTGRGGPQGCETLRLPHFLGHRFIDGGKVVSLNRRPPFTPREDSWYSFLLEAESTPWP